MFVEWLSIKVVILSILFIYNVLAKVKPLFVEWLSIKVVILSILFIYHVLAKSEATCLLSGSQQK